MDDALRAQQAAADRIYSIGVDGVPDNQASTALAQRSARDHPQFHFVPAVGNGSIRRDWRLAPA